ncbi:MAG: hypothetical protein ACKO2E_05105 [Actinomycetota bacterium]
MARHKAKLGLTTFVLVYIVDATIGHGEGTQTLLPLNLGLIE